MPKQNTWEEAGNSWIAMAVLGIVACMLIPMPHEILSMLLIANLAGSVLMLVLALTIKDPLEFVIFPTALLIGTLLDLSLHVSATRLILLHGEAGDVIHSFGSLMAGSSPLVGLVIFVILVIVQFVVITKGAERVAEVAARFTLDAMPGKQMSIDADLSAGLITNTEAKARRESVEQEADFYGAMDGASKFAKGNVIAAMVIILVNLVGGIVAGMVQGGMSFTQVLQAYTILTVGEGLAAQIPSLLIATATGIMVTRVSSGTGLSRALGKQLFSYPKSLQVVGSAMAVLAFFGFFTDLPTIPFALFSLGFFVLAGMKKETGVETEGGKIKDNDSKIIEDPLDALIVPSLELKLGLSLIPMVDASRGGNLAKRLTLVRQNLSREYGIPIPEIRIRDDSKLPGRHYSIHVRGVEAARAQIHPSHWLAMNLPDNEEEVEKLGGVAGIEPAFGIAARWIPEASKAAAMAMGATMVDAGSVMMTHLTEVLKKNLGTMLSRDEVTKMVEHLRKSTPSLVEEVVPNLLALGEVQKVMSLLLNEHVVLSDLPTFFEALALAARENKNPEFLAESCRAALGRVLCSRVSDESRMVHAVCLDPRTEEDLENLDQTPIHPEKAIRLKERLQEALLGLMSRARFQVLLTSPGARPVLAHLTERLDPRPAVLSTREIVPPFEVNTVTTVSWD